MVLELFNLLKPEFVCSLWQRLVTVRTNLWVFEDSSYFGDGRKMLHP